MASCLVSRSAVRPLATRSWGEWSVSTSHSCPSSTAVSTISSIGLPPSDQLECEWQSPLSWAKRSAPPLASGFALPCNDSRYAGQLTVQGFAHHRGGGLPDPGEVLQGAGLVAAAELVLRCLPDRDDGLAEGLDPVGAGPLALEEEGDAPQCLVGLDGCEVSRVRRTGG